MPMVPFHTRFPEIAAAETRSVVIGKYNNIPGGSYGLIESYCDELNCDCRRVFINVISDDSQDEILAIISYGWDTPEFYKKWMGAVANSHMIEMMTHPFLESNCRQAKYADGFLELFEEVIKDKEYVDRINRHYLLFKAAVNEGHQGMNRKKIGRNEPCPCGSGKKYKKCCGV